MTPLKVPPEPYTIEGVMQAIGAQLKDGAASPDDPRAARRTGEPEIDERALLDVARARADVRPAYRIRSHRVLLGLFVNPIKKFVHWASRPYVDLTIENQNRFNEAMLEWAREAGRHIQAAQAEARKREEELSLLLQDLKKLVGAEASSLHSQVDAAEQRLAETQQSLDRIENSLTEQGQHLEKFQNKVESRYDLNAFFSSVPEEKRREFMDRFRGTYDDIKARQYVYAEYFHNRPGQILDVGCGRGEFLETLLYQGIEAWGCDTDPSMVKACESRPIHVRQMDAMEALHSVEDDSLGGVFAAQVIEHMFPGELLEFIRLAYRKLAPGGAVVLESLNPQSLGVLAKSYYKDLDHKQPIDPDYLAKILELAGFSEATPHRTAPFGESERLPALPDRETSGLSEEAYSTLEQLFAKLNNIVWGPQDYHVIAEKPQRREALGEETRQNKNEKRTTDNG